MTPSSTEELAMKQSILQGAVVILLAAAIAGAQAPVGALSGVVTDASGGVIVGATVTTISHADGGKRTAQSNEQGFFLIPTLLPGEYKVTIEYTGFQAFTADPVVVPVGQTVRLDARMPVVGQAVQVEVTGESVTGVDAFQATVGGVINARQIAELPLNGRNYLELARLQPGIEVQEGRAFDPTKARYTGVSIGGRQGREARITIDGVDAVDEHVGTTTLNISTDSIQEFQVSTSSSDSTTGLSATGGVNVITRRGGNAYHGSGFAYGRGSSMAARPNFAAAKPDFDREQYGVNIGGPAVKEKLFWFGNFEKTQESSAISVVTPYFPSLTTYPAPYDEKSSTVRADAKLPRQNDFLFRWSRNDNSSFGGFGGTKLPSGGNFNTNTTHQFVWGLDSALRPNLTNSLRTAYTDFKNRVLKPESDAAAITIPGITGYRILTDDNLLNAGPDNITPQSTFERFHQVRDDVTYSRGNHTWRFGGDVVYRRVEVTNFVMCAPSLTVSSPASRNPTDLLSSTVISFGIGNCNGKRIPGTPDNTHRNTRLSFYATDNWRMSRTFTLNLGLRYEVDTHPLNNDLPKPDIARPLLPRGTDATSLDRNNFAPQVGFAWDPFGDHKTAIRAGAGLYYAMRISNLVTNERASLAPFNSGNDTISISRGQTTTRDFDRDGKNDFDFAGVFTGTVKDALPVVTDGQKVYIAAPQSSLAALAITRSGLLIDNTLSTPYSMQYNIGFQRELPMHSIVDVNFVYSRTVHEFMRDLDVANNFPGNGPPITLGDGLRPTASITRITSDGYSRYRALTVKYDKRFARRFQYTASYALARFETSTADGLGLGGGTLINRNNHANFGPGALDRTHRLSFNGIVDLPLGVRVSLLSTASSGLPATILVGSADLNGDGIDGDPLTGTGRGSLLRDISDVKRLNELIRAYNLASGGRLNLRNQRLPFLFEQPDGMRFGDSYISQDLGVTKMFRFGERLKVEATAQVFNLFNVSNLVGSGGLPSSPFQGTLPTVASDASGNPTGGFRVGSDGALLTASGDRVIGGVNRASGFGSLSAIRPAIPTGTGLPRAFQFGLRLSF
jgi:hypothetical protein